MAIELPAAPKVYTSVYDTFRGVDFTNDSTNVWRRRSPDGVNMLPDDAGRPFKRTGWEVVVTLEELADALNKDVEILKCHYFELAGIDHIMIFTNGGVFVYEEDICTLLSTSNGYASDSTDPDCYASYDRAFFFEGNGVSAFYIYGNHKVWIYGYDNGFYFKQADNIYVPDILFATTPSDCVGEIGEDYNLLGNKAAVLYQDNDMFFSYTTSTSITQNSNRTDFLARKVVATGLTQADWEADKEHYYVLADGVFVQCKADDTWNALETYYEVATAVRGTYTFEYDSDNTRWDLTLVPLSGATTTETNVNLADYGIKILGTPDDEDQIILKYIWGTLLPNNVTQYQKDEVKVLTSVLTAFDNELTVTVSTTAPTATSCSLHTDLDSQPPSNRRAWIEYYAEEKPLIEGEDCIRVAFPVTTVTVTNFPITGHETDCKFSGSASINT